MNTVFLSYTCFHSSGIVTIALTLPPLLFLLKRLFENPGMRHAGIWRIIWVLPLSYFCMFLLAGSPFDVNNFRGNTFLTLTITMDNSFDGNYKEKVWRQHKVRGTGGCVYVLGLRDTVRVGDLGNATPRRGYIIAGIP